MSRTTKDKKFKYKNPEKDSTIVVKKIVIEDDYEYTKIIFLDAPGAKTKKRKKKDTEYHWMTTPSWWVNLMMNRPQRLDGRMWEKEILKYDIQELEGVDTPSVSRKPHVYYW